LQNSRLLSICTLTRLFHLDLHPLNEVLHSLSIVVSKVLQQNIKKVHLHSFAENNVIRYKLNSIQLYTRLCVTGRGFQLPLKMF
jgi:hypothetical protein